MIKRIKAWHHNLMFKRDTKNREEVLKLVAEFFGSKSRAEIWMGSRIPLLGGITPEFMIRAGRSSKLLKFVRQCMEDNKRP